MSTRGTLYWDGASLHIYNEMSDPGKLEERIHLGHSAGGFDLDIVLPVPLARIILAHSKELSETMKEKSWKRKRKS